MSKFPVLPALLGVGAIGAIFLAGSSSASAATTTPAKPPSGGGPEVPVKDPAAPPPGATPGSTAIRKREITKDTYTPSHFALKYSGSTGRWKELAAVNPELKLVDRPTTYGEGSERKTYYTDAKGSVMLEWPTLTPWIVGQVITLPADWKG